MLGGAPAPGTVAGYEIPDSLKGYVTQWGQDPIWNAAAAPTQAMPLPQHFLNAVAVGTELTLDEFSNDPSQPFTAVGHEVSYDDAHGRRLWYCDIEMDTGEAYFPFVRLALARYQSQSLPNAHLSRVVLADFMQLAPDRAASITFDPIDATSAQLALNGLTYTGPGTATMTATLEMQVPGSPDSAWLPVTDIPLTAHTFGGPDTLWTGQVSLPAARGSRPFRLVVREFETYPADSSGSQQQRLVYADILGLAGTVVTAPQPLSGSPLVGYWGSDGSEHVNFIGTDGHVHELYIAPGGHWVDNDLTALASAAAHRRLALDGYSGSDGGQHVNFIGTDNHVHELFIAPAATGSTTTSPHSPAPRHPPSARSRRLLGTDDGQHVNFIGTDSHVHELYIAPGGHWVNNDLTTSPAPRHPPPARSGRLLGPDGGQHVNFIGTDGHVHELYIAPGGHWVNNDLTSSPATPRHPRRPALDGYWGDNNCQHVNFIGTDGHVHELYIHPSAQWVNNDLNHLSGSTAPTVGSALDAYCGTDGSSTSTSSAPTTSSTSSTSAPASNWVNNDLTALASAGHPPSARRWTATGAPTTVQHVNFIGTDTMSTSSTSPQQTGSTTTSPHSRSPEPSCRQFARSPRMSLTVGRLPLAPSQGLFVFGSGGATTLRVALPTFVLHLMCSIAAAAVLASRSCSAYSDGKQR